MLKVNGLSQEDEFFECLTTDHRWNAISCPGWDKEKKIDRVLTSRKGRRLRRQLAVQITMCVDHAEKLDRFLKKDRPSAQSDAEIYVEVEEGVAPKEAAAIFDRAVANKFRGYQTEAGIFMLRIGPNGLSQWFDLSAKTQGRRPFGTGPGRP